MSDSFDPMDGSPPGSSVHGIFQVQILEQIAISYLGDLPDPGIKPASPASPALAGRFFTTEPPGMLYWRKLYKSKAKSWCGTPPYTADTGTTKQLSSGFGRETISYGKLFSYQGKQQLG